LNSACFSASAQDVIDGIWMLMDEFDGFHGHLPRFIGIIGVSAELTPMPFSISVANGVTVAAHWPSHSIDQYHLRSAVDKAATDCLTK